MDTGLPDDHGPVCRLQFPRGDKDGVVGAARTTLMRMQAAALEAGESDVGKDSWPAYPADSHVQGAATGQPKRRSLTVGDWLQLAFFAVFVVLSGLPAFLIVVLDALPLVGDWLTAHVPFWDEVTDFYDWLWSHAS